MSTKTAQTCRSTLRVAFSGLAAWSCLCPPAVDAQAHNASRAVAVTLTVVSKSNCKFTTLPVGALAFGPLDQTRTAPASVSLAAEFKCGGTAKQATFVVRASNGLHHDGVTRRMRDAAGVHYLPYDVSLTPTTATVAKNAPVPLTITALIAVPDFQDAFAGSYSDSITVSVDP